MAGQLTRYLTQPDGAGDLPGKVRVNAAGEASVIDIMMIVCFTGDDGKLVPTARTSAGSYWKRLSSSKEHGGEVKAFAKAFKFPGRGQQDTPVTGRNGMMRILQLLRGKKAAKFREQLAGLLERYIDADPALADDIVDRALDNHAAAREARAAAAPAPPAEPAADPPQPAPPSGTEQHVRLRSRDATKFLGAALKDRGAPQNSYALFNGSVNTAVTGMRTAEYREVQVNLKKGPARDAFTDGMLAMAYTCSTLAGEGIEAGETLGAQIDKMQGRFMQASQLLGLHDTARIVQTVEHIERNKRRMIEDRPSFKRLKSAGQKAALPSAESAPQPPAPQPKPALTLLHFLKPVAKR